MADMIVIKKGNIITAQKSTNIQLAEVSSFKAINITLGIAPGETFVVDDVQSDGVLTIRDRKTNARYILSQGIIKDKINKGIFSIQGAEIIPSSKTSSNKTTMLIVGGIAVVGLYLLLKK